MLGHGLKKYPWFGGKASDKEDSAQGVGQNTAKVDETVKG